MNIQEAKEEIVNAIKAYFTKNEFGTYVIPLEKQRPIFLMGAPGIGKTAIMEQIASELEVALVFYSMTHHTRQSALGLPYIEKKVYDGKEYSVSEYTMSEIIASVYNMMEETGKREGILFLDEINCVSETLAPSMLQFLQYKVFGSHRVPNGWIVVTAGNPPEYNNSVREFDIVTWDRLKRINIEPDYDAWKKYAVNTGIHPSVIAYLDIKKGNFYKIESTVDGKSFVTARGWSDLSTMIRLYEQNGTPVTHRLISQYIQNEKIAKDFSAYYDLFVKYRSTYQVSKILDGEAAEQTIESARTAKFDERLSLTSLLLMGIIERVECVWSQEKVVFNLLEVLKSSRSSLAAVETLIAALHTQYNRFDKDLSIGARALSLSEPDRNILRKTMQSIDSFLTLINKEMPANGKDAFELLKKEYDKTLASHKKTAINVENSIDNAFSFIEQAFGDSNEMMIFVTELTIGKTVTWFISRYGSKKYFAHNKGLLFHERQQHILDGINQLGNLNTDDTDN